MLRYKCSMDHSFDHPIVIDWNKRNPLRCPVTKCYGRVKLNQRKVKMSELAERLKQAKIDRNKIEESIKDLESLIDAKNRGEFKLGDIVTYKHCGKRRRVVLFSKNSGELEAFGFNAKFIEISYALNKGSYVKTGETIAQLCNLDS